MLTGAGRFRTLPRNTSSRSSRAALASKARFVLASACWLFAVAAAASSPLCAASSRSRAFWAAPRRVFLQEPLVALAAPHPYPDDKSNPGCGDDG